MKLRGRMAQLNKILLVDDDEDLREALSEQLLMTEDFDVYEGSSGAEALEKIKQQSYDLMVLDVGLPDLLARLRAQLRQHEQSEDAIFSLGPYTFKPSIKILVTADDKKIRLTEKETNILKFLYRATEHVVPRDILLHEVWGYNASVTTHTLETHIYRLRQKIEPDPGKASILITENGGYRLSL